MSHANGPADRRLRDRSFRYLGQFLYNESSWVALSIYRKWQVCAWPDCQTDQLKLTHAANCTARRYTRERPATQMGKHNRGRGTGEKREILRNVYREELIFKTLITVASPLRQRHKILPREIPFRLIIAGIHVRRPFFSAVLIVAVRNSI